MLLEITQEHIDKNVPCESEECVIANALWDVNPNIVALSVGLGIAYYRTPAEAHYFLLDEEGYALREAADRGGEIVPTTLTLEEVPYWVYAQHT